jgi:hypothetical protein
MKTKLIVILALITLNINLVSAHINSPKGDEGPAKSEVTVPVALLAPVIPAEATFEDATDMNPVVSILSSIAPVTPKEASFEETTPAVTSPVNQKIQTIEKEKTVHPDFPLPCDAKYGCSI